jgi:large conductance mechanosensitive channel
MLKGFKAFVLRGNLVELAVAFVVGAAFSAVVKTFADDLIGGILGVIGGTPDFGNAGFTVNGSKIVYGTTLTALISFLITAATVYFVLVVPMIRLTGGPQDEPGPTRDQELLTEIRDLLAQQSRR